MEKKPSPAGSQPPSLERRLATIMVADVLGYSRMMGEAEERTIEILRGHRQIFDQLLAQHRGRVFNTAGDAILAEFPSAVEAVRCATEIQTALRTRNDHLPPEQRMLFRIGINLGDVIVQGSDLLGDGVNVAARIQTVADPGGVCVSGSVYDQIQNKLSLQFRQLGEKSFKNISQPVRTFSIDGEGGPRPSAWRRRAWKNAVAGVAAVVVLAAIGAGYWQYREHEGRVAEETRAAEAKQQTEREHAAAEATSREAALQAELKASREALAQAEANKRKAELDRASAEAAQREAKLQADLKLAKDAQQRAEASEKRAEEARAAAAASLKAAETSARKTPEPKVPPPSSAQVALAAPTTSPSAGGVERFDGVYKGRMCNFAGTDRERCWPTTLMVEGGVVSSDWPTRTEGQVAHAKGKFAPDGKLTVGLDGYNQQGGPLRGMLVGSWDSDKISATGAWRNNVAVSGNWTRQ